MPGTVIMHCIQATQVTVLKLSDVLCTLSVIMHTIILKMHISIFVMFDVWVDERNLMKYVQYNMS